MPSKVEKEAWILEYIERRGQMFGWDWEADHAWALYIGDTEAAELISLTMGAGILAFQLNAYYHPVWRRVYRSRMRLLRRMVKSGQLFSYWSGMPSSVTDGASRCKSYVIEGTEHARTMHRLMSLSADPERSGRDKWRLRR